MVAFLLSLVGSFLDFLGTIFRYLFWNRKKRTRRGRGFPRLIKSVQLMLQKKKWLSRFCELQISWGDSFRYWGNSYSRIELIKLNCVVKLLLIQSWNFSFWNYVLQIQKAQEDQRNEYLLRSLCSMIGEKLHLHSLVCSYLFGML